MPVVMEADRIARTLIRIAHEVVEQNRVSTSLRWSASVPAACPSLAGWARTSWTSWTRRFRAACSTSRCTVMISCGSRLVRSP